MNETKRVLIFYDETDAALAKLLLWRLEEEEVATAVVTESDIALSAPADGDFCRDYSFAGVDTSRVQLFCVLMPYGVRHGFIENAMNYVINCSGSGSGYRLLAVGDAPKDDIENTDRCVFADVTCAELSTGKNVERKAAAERAIGAFVKKIVSYIETCDNVTILKDDVDIYTKSQKYTLASLKTDRLLIAMCRELSGAADEKKVKDGLIPINNYLVKRFKLIQPPYERRMFTFESAPVIMRLIHETALLFGEDADPFLCALCVQICNMLCWFSVIASAAERNIFGEKAKADKFRDHCQAFAILNDSSSEKPLPDGVTMASLGYAAEAQEYGELFRLERMLKRKLAISRRINCPGLGEYNHCHYTDNQYMVFLAAERHRIPDPNYFSEAEAALTDVPQTKPMPVSADESSKKFAEKQLECFRILYGSYKDMTVHELDCCRIYAQRLQEFCIQTGQESIELPHFETIASDARLNAKNLDTTDRENALRAFLGLTTRGRYDVFISYRSKILNEKNEEIDNPYARRLFRFINSNEEYPIRAFFDDARLSEEGNTRFAETLIDSLDNSDNLLLLLTGPEDLSDWVRFELNSFHWEVEHGRKSGGILILMLNSWHSAGGINELPKYLQNEYEVIPFDPDKLNNAVDKVISYIRGQKAKAAAPGTGGTDEA